MAELGDFNTIIGNSPVTIGDANPHWEKAFGTGGVNTGAEGFLLMNVRNLTFATSEVAVRINGIQVGNISPYPGSNPNYWYTQMIHVSGAVLKSSGLNVISIDAVGYPNSSDSDHFDDFSIKNMIIFFHQYS